MNIEDMPLEEQVAHWKCLYKQALSEIEGRSDDAHEIIVAKDVEIKRFRDILHRIEDWAVVNFDEKLIGFITEIKKDENREMV